MSEKKCMDQDTAGHFCNACKFVCHTRTSKYTFSSIVYIGRLPSIHNPLFCRISTVPSRKNLVVLPFALHGPIGIYVIKNKETSANARGLFYQRSLPEIRTYVVWALSPWSTISVMPNIGLLFPRYSKLVQIVFKMLCVKFMRLRCSCEIDFWFRFYITEQIALIA